MKTSNALTILARRNALTEEEWQGLVRARLEMIKPHLREISLGAVGDLKMIHDYFHAHDIKSDQPEVDGEGELTLETRGIFPPDYNWAEVSNNTEYHKNETGCFAETSKLWGFTRNGQWMSVEVRITRSKEPYKYPGRTEEVAKARKVILRTATFPEICVFSNRTPEYFWKTFGGVIKKWAEHRKRLYEDAQSLVRGILSEEEVFQAVPKK